MPSKVAPEVVTKRPSESRKYTFQFSSDLDSGDTITSFDSGSSSPSGLSFSSLVASGTTAQCIVGSGVAGTDYLATVQVTTANGYTLEGQAWFQVRE